MFINHQTVKTDNKMHNKQQFNEGLEHGDLKRLIHPEIHVDEFKSKMGDDADVVVVSFKVTDKEPALDLVNFIEKGYDWVLDADVSSGELDDGDYLVFVELERTPGLGERVMELLDDILNLTEQDINEWTFRYQKDGEDVPVSSDAFSVVPKTPKAYNDQFGDKDIERMQESARVPINKKAPVNDFTESLRIAAGLK